MQKITKKCEKSIKIDIFEAQMGGQNVKKMTLKLINVNLEVPSFSHPGPLQNQ